MDKIYFKLTSNELDKLAIIENLKSLFKKEKDEENIAFLNYEISLMLHDLNRDNSKYNNKAIDILKKLYNKTPNIEYKNSYEELEKLK